MTIEEIKALFPLKGQLTQSVLDKSKIVDIFNCNGALTLQEATGKPFGYKIYWGIKRGFIESQENTIQIGTEEDIDFMDARKPQEVTFILI